MHPLNIVITDEAFEVFEKYQNANKANNKKLNYNDCMSNLLLEFGEMKK